MFSRLPPSFGSIRLIQSVRHSKKCPGLSGRKERRGAAQPHVKKLQQAEEIRHLFATKNMAIVVQYDDLAVDEWKTLRHALAKSDVQIRVFPNKIVAKALSTTKYEAMCDLFAGATALAYSDGNPVRAVTQTIRDTPKIRFLGGRVDDVILSQSGLFHYSQLGTLDELRAELVGVVNELGSALTRAIAAESEKLSFSLKSISK